MHMKLKLYIELVCLPTFLVHWCQCENIYKKVGDTAYFIGVGDSDERVFDWFDARESCWVNSGELVSVLTSDQMIQLQNFIVSEGYTNGSTFGTSGHSYVREYRFKWEALDQSLKYTKWLPGEEPPADCNLSLQLIDSELYMIKSWGYDQYYICEYSTLWRRIQKYFHVWKYHFLFIFSVFFLCIAVTWNRRTKSISHNPPNYEIKKFVI